MGCICLIPSNKDIKLQKIAKPLNNTGRLSKNVITVNSGLSIPAINPHILNQMNPTLWFFILQFLSSDDLFQVSQCNKELKEISKQKRTNPKGYIENCVINVNQALNNCNKNIVDIHNISQDSFPTVFNSNLQPLDSKVYNTLSFNKTISLFSNKKSSIENDQSRSSNDKLILVNTHLSEPSKLYPIKTKIHGTQKKSVHRKEGNSYIDAFTQQQIDLSNNSLSIYKKKSLSNLSLDLENETPSFSEDNSCNNNQILNITNINTIQITPIIFSKMSKVNSYMNQVSVLTKKDNG